MISQIRHSLSFVAVIAIAGCNGAPTTPLVAPASQTTAAIMHAVMPLAPRRPNVDPQSIHATYPTGQSLLFEADANECAVNIYQTAHLSSNPAPIAAIHTKVFGGFCGAPYGVAIDKAGTIYVATELSSNGDVELYPKGSTTVKSSITNGIDGPIGLAVDGSGTLYVANSASNPASIVEYAHGVTTPSKIITGGGITAPLGVALDNAGNLYIADAGAKAILELPAGGSTVQNLNLTDLGTPIGVAIDSKTGNLWETGGGGNVINIYNLSQGTSPIKTLKGNGYPYAISIQHKGTPLGEVVESDGTSNSVYAYKPGHYKPYAVLTNGMMSPTGLLIAQP